MTDLSSYKNTALTVIHLHWLAGQGHIRIGELSKALKLSRYMTIKLVNAMVADGLIDNDGIRRIRGIWRILPVACNEGDIERGMQHLAIIRSAS